MPEKLIDMIVRVGIIAISVLLALIFQLSILGPLCRPDDWLKLIALSFAAHAFIQLVLRYSLLPNPRFRIGEVAATMLGPSEEVEEGGLEGDALKRAQRQNWLRKFLVLNIAVEHKDAPRWIRALGSRTPVEGAAVRFRYRELGSRGRWTEWRFGRWGDVLQPIDSSGTIDLRAVETNHRLPRLYPSDLQDAERPWQITFAMKERGKDEFCHFNDRSYLYGPGWRNPEWVLPGGTYEVEAELAGYGLSHKRRCTFYLTCSTTEFRIQTSRSLKSRH